MATKARFKREEIRGDNRAFSPSRTTIETAFYGNNVEKVFDLKKAYKMAQESPGTITLDMPVFEPEK